MTTHTTGQARSCHHYPNRVLQKRDLATELGGVCEKTVDNLLKAGLLPQPCWLNSIPVWMLHDVHTFISNRSGVARRAEEPARLPLASLDAYIDRHAGHPLQVADLARLAGLSAARFHARFLAETGQTPMDYVRQRRLQLGRELLCATHLAVGEIAARVGYASQSAFTAALVRQFGSTPRQIRREARDNSR